MTSTLGINSTVYNFDFIDYAWSARAKMTEYERKGFYSFIFVSLFSHFEYFLRELLCFRIGPFNLRINKDNNSTSIDSKILLIDRLISKKNKDISRATYVSLKEIYLYIIGESLICTIGPDNYQSIDSLSVLRNIISHGNDWYFNFNDKELIDPDFKSDPNREKIVNHL